MENFNPAFSTNYRFMLPDAPELNYFAQTAQLPGTTASGVETPYRGHQAFFQADRIDYDPLSYQFIVDEDFKNYLYLYNWMRDCTTKEKPPKYQKDGTLHILTANKTHNLMVDFHGCFPMSLGSVDFESSVADPATLMCNVIMRYNYFTIKVV